MGTPAKRTLWDLGALCVLALAVALVVGGCSALEAGTAPKALPVQIGAASTNDVPLVAWLQLAQMANRTLTPQPYQEGVNVVLGGVITVIAGLAGWWARHKRPGDS